MNLLEQIARHLEFVGIGLAATTEQDGSIFWGAMPDIPDKAVCIFSSDSGAPGTDHGARVQIMARAKTTRQAYELSQQIAEELIDYNGFLAGDGPNVWIEAINTSNGVGYDEKRRDLYVSNFIVRYCDD